MYIIYSFKVDQFSRSILSCNYDGSDTKFILTSIHGLENPYSITLFENSVYWSDSKNEKIYKANKLSGELSKFEYSNVCLFSHYIFIILKHISSNIIFISLDR